MGSQPGKLAGPAKHANSRQTLLKGFSRQNVAFKYLELLAVSDPLVEELLKFLIPRVD